MRVEYKHSQSAIPIDLHQSTLKIKHMSVSKSSIRSADKQIIQRMQSISYTLCITKPIERYRKIALAFLVPA